MVPPSLIYEYGCLRKGNKSVLCNLLGVVQVDPSTSDVVIVDMQQMLYHIIGPHGGAPPMLFENTKQRVSSHHGYPPGTENILFLTGMMTPQPRTTRVYDVVVRVLQTTI